MSGIWSKGVTYFGIVFTFAFATGAVRVLLVAPKIGTTAALLVEVPVLIVVSWVVARRLLRNCAFGPEKCVAMGFFAFLLMMASEATLSFIMRGQSPVEWVDTLATPIGIVGLTGQLVFAAIPFLIVRFGVAFEGE